jgi:hypothetical protein
MATLYTDVGTIENAPHVGDAYNSPQRNKGKVRRVQAVITFAAGQIGDIVNICKLRKGDEVCGGVMINAALGASSTLQIGDDCPTADDDRYLAATATSSAARTEFPATDRVALVPFTVTQDSWLQAKIAGGAVTGKVIFYVDILRQGA